MIFVIEGNYSYVLFFLLFCLLYGLIVFCLLDIVLVFFCGLIILLVDMVIKVKLIFMFFLSMFILFLLDFFILFEL